MKENLYSNRLITKLIISFLAVLLLAGIGFTVATFYFSNHYLSETTQRLHANLAQDLIDEKFVSESPIDSLGNVNKALFGDIMHDMMGINRAIEVYLLDMEGKVQYSVVLDHSDPKKQQEQVALAPIETFIAQNGNGYILGDNPRSPGEEQIFSAAKFSKGGKEGYIYIILAGQDYSNTKALLFGGYAQKMGLGISILTLFFAGLLGILSIWYLTKNLREISYAAKRFQQGDLEYRIAAKHKTDLTGLANTYNEMADTILKDMEHIKSLENMRRELIANISHDLRTPLSVIQGYIETLKMKEGQLSESDKERYMDIISSSGERLSKMIAQLFEYSKLEAKQITPKKEPFLLSELAHDICNNYEVLAQKKNIQFSLDIPENVPLVFADISLVERAIQNLIDNALKFTPENGTVTLQLVNNNKEVAILIKDDGPGITEENQALIFERYRQTKQSHEKEGAGLGLAIVRKIVELHNASIKVLSKPNEGTIFSFSLPIYNISNA
ncbi:HAMP domain-containing sensor histidine kinase [Flavobacterium sp. ASW18X]|uniref:sensor histidine kinase n=1 Tax=Flavobacterium sp. ASW18X TaxID=2572595 RepID=UPI0010ADBDE4|nr:HAMP domain-containing sensor histidine kinase [Flavobacterium sp. ASW18X]TKD66706.1 HAMP domain-containing histidine kinase [Flavobacterium sp. ASW18X]